MHSEMPLDREDCQDKDINDEAKDEDEEDNDDDDDDGTDDDRPLRRFNQCSVRIVRERCVLPARAVLIILSLFGITLNPNSNSNLMISFWILLGGRRAGKTRTLKL